MPWWLYVIGYVACAMIMFRVIFVTSGESREEFFKDEEFVVATIAGCVLWPIAAVFFGFWGAGHLLTFPTRRQRRELKAKREALELQETDLR